MTDALNQRSLSLHREAGRREQLDSLRAFAVFGVMYSHFWNDSWIGSAGVLLFFVLSGYLITGILLGSRGTPLAFRNFYLRRILRIAPIYYATLALAWLINLNGIRESILWHLFYLSNVWFTLHNSWSPASTSHLWTLSVEEQFYLVWPFLILFLPIHAIRPVVWGAIAAAIVYQCSAPSFGINEFGQYTLPWASLDALGVGAILALAEAKVGLPLWLTKAGWAACAVFAALEVLPINRDRVWAQVLHKELLIVIFAALVAASSSGVSGKAGVILNLRILQYVGRISYGIYLFHLFIRGVVAGILRAVGLPPLKPGLALFLLMSAMSIAVASVSWRFVERPINLLKSRFR